MNRCCKGEETPHLASNIPRTEFQTEQPQRTTEEDSVRNNTNRKRVQKEEKKAEKKAAKKAAKGKR